MKLSVRVRWLALAAAVVQLVTGRHVYLSTGCLTGDHRYCQAPTGFAGVKQGSQAKFTNAPCVCSCHRRAGVAS